MRKFVSTLICSLARADQTFNVPDIHDPTLPAQHRFNFREQREITGGNPNCYGDIGAFYIKTYPAGKPACVVDGYDFRCDRSLIV